MMAVAPWLLRVGALIAFVAFILVLAFQGAVVFVFFFGVVLVLVAWGFTRTGSDPRRSAAAGAWLIFVGILWMAYIANSLSTCRAPCVPQFTWTIVVPNPLFITVELLVAAGALLVWSGATGLRKLRARPSDVPQVATVSH